MAKKSRGMWVVFLMLLSCMLMPIVTADNSPSQPEINTRWLPDQFGENVNSYRITFADDKSYQVDLMVIHDRSNDFYSFLFCPDKTK